MVVEFRFSFLVTTLLCFTRLDCFTFFFYTLLSPHSLPCHGNVGMAICCGFSWEGTLEKILGWWNKKHKREWEIHKKLRFVTCSFSSFSLNRNGHRENSMGKKEAISSALFSWFALKSVRGKKVWYIEFNVQLFLPACWCCISCLFRDILVCYTLMFEIRLDAVPVPNEGASLPL